jgi:hypothetical protein
MSESTLWNKLEPKLRELHPVRIENLVGEGQPDVNYVMGWIELKDVARFPMKRRGLRTSQIVWIRSRVAVGGIVWIIVRCKGVIYARRIQTMAEVMQINDWKAETWLSSAHWSTMLGEPEWPLLVFKLKAIYN